MQPVDLHWLATEVILKSDPSLKLYDWESSSGIIEALKQVPCYPKSQIAWNAWMCFFSSIRLQANFSLALALLFLSVCHKCPSRFRNEVAETNARKCAFCTTFLHRDHLGQLVLGTLDKPLRSFRIDTSTEEKRQVWTGICYSLLALCHLLIWPVCAVSTKALPSSQIKAHLQ